MATFLFDLVSPARLVFSGQVDQVDVPGVEGDFGVLAGHAPYVALVKPGVLTVFAGGDAVRYVVLGGFAEVAVAPEFLTFKLPEALDFVQGAGLIVNYHTAYFALVTRGRLKAGETVLMHGAAGGVGTATLQVAKALRARTVAVVSDDEKERFAREAGADEVLRSTGPWRDEAKELSGGGVDVVIDPVGGERFTVSLRSLRRCGRLVAVGFSGGEIPAVKVNRLLLNSRGRRRSVGRVRIGRP